MTEPTETSLGSINLLLDNKTFGETDNTTFCNWLRTKDIQLFSIYSANKNNNATEADSMYSDRKIAPIIDINIRKCIDILNVYKVFNDFINIGIPPIIDTEINNYFD